jgi:predicted nucleotidyltransferase component of viral defense system
MLSEFLWEEILKEAQRRGISPQKKRAVLREFLQVKFLTSFYRFSGCQNFSFIGGTSLRLLRGLDRFSEDIDFDNFGLEIKETKKLLEKTANELKKENLKLDFDFKKTKSGGTARMRFPDLLYQLKISQNPKEKLMIKIDFSYQPRVETEVLLLARFGMSERVITNTLPVLLSQKFRALISRKQTRGRDFYDIFWLLAKGIKPNLTLLKFLNIKSEKEFFEKIKEIYRREEKNIPFYKRQIRPFLINEENVRFLDDLPQLLEQLAF